MRPEEVRLFTPVDPKVQFPKMEEAILRFWADHSIFERSIEQRSDAPEFVFYDGPPFATGLPHFGHFVPGTIKDIIPRYQTMQGKRVERRFGWDCHGLPVEYEMEKELGISGRAAIEDYGVANFNEACRSIVLRYTNEWRTIMTRAGRWVDFDHDYKTMDADYMESIWWVFKQLWQKGLVYEGYYILPYSTALATPLSNFEVNLGGYRDVVDPAITVRFEITDDVPPAAGTGSRPDGNPGKAYFLAWTTTPWTLPSNLGLALGPDITYVRVVDKGDVYILAETRLDAYYREDDRPEVLEGLPGSALAGISYRPVFPYFAHLATQGGFRTHTAGYVTTEDGTGIVHIAPGFGEDDYHVLKDSGLPIIVPIDADGRFTDEVPDFTGLPVKEADKPIIRRLKEEGTLVKRENYTHSYPHCYRTGTPLIYRAVSSWFVDIEKVKSAMLDANSKVRWVPDHMKGGRFGRWLEGARDWAISRNRFWGNPIPIWKSDGGDYVECIGSRAELEEKSGVKVTDLHKHYVDDLTWPAPDGSGTMRRVAEVLDCWFESGAMPYAQSHYPFQNRERFEANYPADFIAEGLDQTRGWFYTLTVLGAALFESNAFQNVVVNGLVLAEDGRKMSKSKRNYTDPVEVINEFGADALRVFLMNSAVVKGEDLKYSDDGVREVLKNVLIPLWNGYSFFVTYANIDDIRPTTAPEDPVNPLDRWILSEVNTLVKNVTEALDSYELHRAVPPIVEFVDLLNNWYIRRSRRRFWRSENDVDKREAYETLYSVLLVFVRTAAPIIPFVTEAIYRNLRADDMPESVHLCAYPVAGERDTELERKMATARRAVTMGRALRSMHTLRMRLPLRAVYVVTRDPAERAILREMEDLIREELNVKSVVFREDEEDLVSFSAKANFRVLGKQLGKDMKEAAQKIEDLTQREIQGLLEGTTLTIDVAGRSIDLREEHVVVHRSEREGMRVLNEGSLTMALDSTITDELRDEGLVRDAIRGVQNLRKTLDLRVTDRIVLRISGDHEVRSAVDRFRELFSGETLATAIKWEDTALKHTIEMGEMTCTAEITVDTVSHEPQR